RAFCATTTKTYHGGKAQPSHNQRPKPTTEARSHGEKSEKTVEPRRRREELSGAGRRGKTMRHIKFESQRDVERSFARRYIQAAPVGAIGTGKSVVKSARGAASKIRAKKPRRKYLALQTQGCWCRATTRIRLYRPFV